MKEHSYPNPPLYLDGDCTDVATVGMAVAVSILVAFVTACVKVGPPRAELAAWETQMSFQVLIFCEMAQSLITVTYSTTYL